jgi:Ca2+-binding RTX toxin-like protein
MDMATLQIRANQVFGSQFGHMQFVFSAGSAPALEIEVQGSAVDWVVSPVQVWDASVFNETSYIFTQSDLDGRNVRDVWQLLVNARDFFAGQSIDYQILTQNSNSYITTLLHIVGLNSANGPEDLLGNGITDLPGAERNVLFTLTDRAGDAAPLINLELKGTRGADRISGGVGADSLSGAAGADTIFGFSNTDDLRGGGHRDMLFGGGGDDAIHGNGGADRLDGAAGRDVLIGGRGGDVLSGGAKADVFVFLSKRDGADEIADFTAGSDIIEFRVARLAFEDLAIIGETDAQVSYGRSTITLTGVGASALDVDDFSFV